MTWQSGDSLNPTNMNNQTVSNLTVNGTLSVGTLLSTSGTTSTFSFINVDSGTSWVYTGSWEAADAKNLIQQNMDAADTSNGPIGLAVYTELTGGSNNYPSGFFNTLQYNSADNHTGWLYPLSVGFEHNGSGDVTRVEVLGFSGGLAAGSSGDVGHMLGIKVAEPYLLGTGSIGTWYAGHFQGAVSILSSTLSLPTKGGNPYLYTASNGSLYWVNSTDSLLVRSGMTHNVSYLSSSGLSTSWLTAVTVAASTLSGVNFSAISTSYVTASGLSTSVLTAQSPSLGTGTWTGQLASVQSDDGTDWVPAIYITKEVTLANSSAPEGLSMYHYSSATVGTVDAMYGVGIGCENAGAASVTTLAGGYVYLGIGASGGTVANGLGLLLDSPYENNPATTFQNLYGLLVGDQVKGTANYAIKTGKGIVALGDAMSMVSATNFPSLASGKGFLYVDSAGSLFFVNGSGVTTGIA